MGVYSGREGGDLPGTAILTLPEEVQLMLRLNSGRVAFGWVELAAAALIELVLTGRVSVQPARGFFRGVDDRNLVVVDPTPTGHSVLDSALAVLVAHAKPWRAMRSL